MAGIPWDEIELHNTQSSRWIVISGKVYDVTKFIRNHPGGADVLIGAVATDATALFRGTPTGHRGAEVTSLLAGMLVGRVDASDPSRELPDVSAVLSHKEQHTPNSILLTFRFTEAVTGLEAEAQLGPDLFGMWPGQHLVLKAKVDGMREIWRPYSPIAFSAESFTLAVKLYPRLKGVPPFSQFLDNIKVGHHIRVKGPVGSKCTYRGEATFRVRSAVDAVTVRRVCLLAAGSGVTPIYQYARALCSEKQDEHHVRVRVLCCFKSPGEAMLANELKALAQEYPKRLSLDWAFSDRTGTIHHPRANLQVLQAVFGEAQAEPCMTITCGPPRFMAAMDKCLAKLKYQQRIMLGNTPRPSTAACTLL